jgi:hypothetical protein
MKRDDFEWAREKEPTYRGRQLARPFRTEAQRRAVLALRYGGPCSVCHAEVCTCCEHEVVIADNAVRRCVSCGVESK